MERPSKILIWLRFRAGWSESSVGAHYARFRLNYYFMENVLKVVQPLEMLQKYLQFILIVQLDTLDTTA